MRKLNCWEFKLCERQPGGLKESELGACSAATTTEFNKINSGVNGGRYCWSTPETLCEFEQYGTFISRHETCTNCEFKRLVIAEENVNFRE